MSMNELMRVRMEMLAEGSVTREDMNGLFAAERCDILYHLRGNGPRRRRDRRAEEGGNGK